MAASRQFTVNELAELKRDFEESVLDESGSIDKWDLINLLQKHDAYDKEEFKQVPMHDFPPTLEMYTCFVNPFISSLYLSHLLLSHPFKLLPFLLPFHLVSKLHSSLT